MPGFRRRWHAESAVASCALQITPAPCKRATAALCVPQAVTCLVADSISQVMWAGREDGSVTVVHPADQHSAPAPRNRSSSSSMPAAVSSMAVDAKGCCWVGYKDGTLQVLSESLLGEQRALVQHAAAGGPVHAILCLQKVAVSSSQHTLQVWDCNSLQQVALADCSPFGAALSLAALEGHQLLPPGAVSKESGSHSSWRLLSGHANGQIVVWRLTEDQQLLQQAVVGVFRPDW